MGSERKLENNSILFDLIADQPAFLASDQGSYSPELNPDELLNADLKHSVTTAAPARTAKALTRTAVGSLRSIQKQPLRVQSYFLHKDVSYAAS